MDYEYWDFMTNVKYMYIDFDLIYRKAVTKVNIITAVPIVVTLLTSWGISERTDGWKIVFIILLAASQFFEAFDDYLYCKKRKAILPTAKEELNNLFLDVENNWHNVYILFNPQSYTPKISNKEKNEKIEELNNKLSQYRETLSSITLAYCKDNIIYKNEKIESQAETDKNAYFRSKEGSSKYGKR